LRKFRKSWKISCKYEGMQWLYSVRNLPTTKTSFVKDSLCTKIKIHPHGVGYLSSGPPEIRLSEEMEYHLWYTSKAVLLWNNHLVLYQEPYYLGILQSFWQDEQSSSKNYW
jgi:hypothetical protein